ncbi:hypothetical protein NHX12_008826, partial [Muraenolepis orangiensis]
FQGPGPFPALPPGPPSWTAGAAAKTDTGSRSVPSWRWARWFRSPRPIRREGSAGGRGSAGMTLYAQPWT